MLTLDSAQPLEEDSIEMRGSFVKTYLGILGKAPGGWINTFPAFPGLSVQSEFELGVVTMAARCLNDFIANAELQGSQVPAARTIDDMKKDPALNGRPGINWDSMRTMSMEPRACELTLVCLNDA
jgi:hypothetical protein